MTIEETSVVEDVVVVEEPKKKTRAKKKTFLFNEELYSGPEFSANHRIKCRVRAAKVFGVTIEHLEKVYFELNGKKIDGIYVTQLIDRYGFSNGKQASRAQIASKHGYDDNITPVEVAESKIKSILQNDNVKKAYVEHLRDIKDEFIKETNDKAIYGE